jgi:hypothetical protein
MPELVVVAAPPFAGILTILGLEKVDEQPFMPQVSFCGVTTKVNIGWVPVALQFRETGRPPGPDMSPAVTKPGNDSVPVPSLVTNTGAELPVIATLTKSQPSVGLAFWDHAVEQPT